MLTAEHGSCEKVILKNDRYEAIFKPYEYIDAGEYTYEYYAIQEMQKGGIDFLIDIDKEEEFRIKWNPNVVFQNLCLLGINPSIKLANALGDLRMLDDDFRFLGNPDTFCCYLANPIKLVSDLHNAYWKIGFKKRLLKINFKYYKFRAKEKLKKVLKIVSLSND